jgi:putative ABC transport system permease protein
MIAPRWAKVGRDLTVHLPRTVLVALAIAASLAGAGTILTSWALIRRTTHEGYLASNPAFATLRLAAAGNAAARPQVDSALLARLRQVPGVRQVQARRTTFLPLLVQGRWRPGVIFAADAPESLAIGTLAAVGGAWPPAEGTLAIERSSLGFSGTFLGDSVAVADSGAEPRLVPVSALVRDVSLAPGWMEHLVYAWATTRTLAQLGLDAAPNELQLTVTDRGATREQVRRVAAAAAQLVRAAGIPVAGVDVPEPGEHVHAAQMDSLMMTQGAFALMALLVGAFLIVNLMAAMLAAQGREIAVMKVLGGRHEQLTAMYLAFALFTGVLATALALPVAVALGRRYATFRAELLNFDVTPFGTPWWSVALLVLVGLLLPLAAAWFPVRRAARQSVADALRDVGLTHDGAAREEPLLARGGGWSRLFVLSVRNAFRRRQRLVLTMLTLAGGGSVFIAAGNLRRAVGDSLDVIFGSQRYTFSVRLAEPHDPDSIAAIVRGVAGVSGAEAWNGARATVGGDDVAGAEGASFSIVGAPANSALLALDLGASAPFPARGARALVVSRTLQREIPSLRTGALVELDINGTRAPWRIAGAFDGGPGSSAYSSAEAVADARGDRRRGSVMVATALTSDASQVELVQRVRAALEAARMPVSSSTLLDESRRVTEDHLLMVVQFLVVMGWVMLVVGGMGLASTMGLAVLERTREIGIMRAIGARHATLITAIEGEGLVIALLGWTAAIPLSVPVSAALAEAFSRIMLRVPVYWTPDAASVAQWLGVVLVTSVVACAWPAARATRVSVARALAYE